MSQILRAVTFTATIISTTTFANEDLRPESIITKALDAATIDELSLEATFQSLTKIAGCQTLESKGLVIICQPSPPNPPWEAIVQYYDKEMRIEISKFCTNIDLAYEIAIRRGFQQYQPPLLSHSAPGSSKRYGPTLYKQIKEKGSYLKFSSTYRIEDHSKCLTSISLAEANRSTENDTTKTNNPEILDARPNSIERTGNGLLINQIQI